MKHVSEDMKVCVPIRNFEFPCRFGGNRNSKVVLRRHQFLDKVKSADFGQARMKSFWRKSDEGVDPRISSVKSKSMQFDESFTSCYAEFGKLSRDFIHRNTMQRSLKSVESCDSIKIISLSPEKIVKSRPTPESNSSSNSDFKMIRNLLKVDKNPVKDWTVKETFTFPKPIHSRKTKSINPKSIHSLKASGNKKKFTAWIPQPVTFLSASDIIETKK